jgi:hypothetical protein
MTWLKTIRTTLVFALLRQFGSWFSPFNITGQTQYTNLVDEYIIYL